MHKRYQEDLHALASLQVLLASEFAHQGNYFCRLYMESEDDDFCLYTQAAIDEHEEDEAFLDWITALEVTDFSFEICLDVCKIFPNVGST